MVRKAKDRITPGQGSEMLEYGETDRLLCSKKVVCVTHKLGKEEAGQ